MRAPSLWHYSSKMAQWTTWGFSYKQMLPRLKCYLIQNNMLFFVTWDILSCPLGAGYILNVAHFIEIFLVKAIFYNCFVKSKLRKSTWILLWFLKSSLEVCYNSAENLNNFVRLRVGQIKIKKNNPDLFGCQSWPWHAVVAIAIHPMI